MEIDQLMNGSQKALQRAINPPPNPNLDTEQKANKSSLLLLLLYELVLNRIQFILVLYFLSCCSEYFSMIVMATCVLCCFGTLEISLVMSGIYNGLFLFSVSISSTTCSIL